MLQTCIRGAFILKTPLGPKCFHDTAGAIDFTPLHCHFRRGGRSAFIASPPSCDAMLAYASSALCPPSLSCRVVHTLGNDQKRRPVKPSRWLIVISSYNPLVLAAQPRCTRFVFLFVFQSPSSCFLCSASLCVFACWHSMLVCNVWVTGTGEAPRVTHAALQPHAGFQPLASPWDGAEALKVNTLADTG